MELHRSRLSVWRETAPFLLLNALEQVTDRFDAVVVDEGQDFCADWWIALEMINARGEKGPFYVFYDPAQNLYVGEQLSLPDLGAPFDLPTNCRNTRQIAKTCSQIRGVDIAVRDEAPEGVESVVMTLPTPEARAKAIKQHLDDWLGKGKLKPSQIAILSPYDQSNSCLAGLTKVGKTDLCTNPNEWRSNKGVLVSTIRRFKGLEADAVTSSVWHVQWSIGIWPRLDAGVHCIRRSPHGSLAMAGIPKV